MADGFLGSALESISATVKAGMKYHATQTAKTTVQAVTGTGDYAIQQPQRDIQKSDQNSAEPLTNTPNPSNPQLMTSQTQNQAQAQQQQSASSTEQQLQKARDELSELTRQMHKKYYDETFGEQSEQKKKMTEEAKKKQEEELEAQKKKQEEEDTFIKKNTKVTPPKKSAERKLGIDG